MTRLFFATDLHGSDVCWRKFLNAGRFYQADVLILSGDMTGRVLVPMVQHPDGSVSVTFLERERLLPNDDQAMRVEQDIANRGCYPFRMSADQFAAYNSNPGQFDGVLRERILSRMRNWMALADERLEGSGVVCFVCPSSDDQIVVNETVRETRHVRQVEGQVAFLPGGSEMISTGWTPRDPRDRIRKADECALHERIDEMARQIKGMSRAVFNLHPPPYGSGLDETPSSESKAPGLRHAEQSMVPAGSVAVHDAIMAYQPMLSLHGHIREGRGAVRLGRTVSVNPGNAIEQDQLLGAVLDIDRQKGLLNYALTSG